MSANILLKLSLLSILFINCSSPAPQISRIEEGYRSAGVIRYFLPDIPKWAHRSESMACFRSWPIKMIDMDALRTSFNLSYDHGLQFQRLYNEEYRRLSALAYSQSLSIQEEEALFFRTMDSIRAGVFSFNAPDFKQVHLVMIDEAMINPQALSALKDLMQSEVMTQGHPVFISLCSSADQLESFLVANDFKNNNIRLITADMVASYSLEGKLLPYSRLFIDPFFKKDQKLILFHSQRQKPIEVEGNYQLQKY